jgi:hypothetical protein
MISLISFNKIQQKLQSNFNQVSDFEASPTNITIYYSHTLAQRAKNLNYQDMKPVQTLSSHGT